SNLFVPAVRLVWNECFRVLRKGGELLADFCNPAMFIFDNEKSDEGILEVRYKLPYSDMTHMTPEELQAYVAANGALEFGHTLDDQIGGQLDAVCVLTGFYEDVWPGQPLSEYMPHY